MTFREDGSRTRDLNAEAEVTLLRRVALSLLRGAGCKGSVETRRLMAARDDEFLLQVLQGTAAHRVRKPCN